MKLKIAIQKSGRLLDSSINLLKDCGIQLNNGVNKLRTEAYNFPLEVLFLRDDDIPQYVADGVADIGIVGENVVLEKRKQVMIIEPLDFARCKLSIAIPKADTYNSREWLQGKRIATSYPVILHNFLEQNNIAAEIHEISGSVEIAPGIGITDCICDLVSSGSTLFLNGLKEVEVVLRSEAVIIGSDTINEEKQALLNKLLFRIRAVKKSKRYKYILLNAPDADLEKICSLIPGMKSPTILPLATLGWSSLHSVVHEDDFWNIIESLKEAGAQGILVSPIEKMIL
jgi:ATP phosphoribosyltransferase